MLIRSVPFLRKKKTLVVTEPKINQTPIEINGKLDFSQIWDGETSGKFIYSFKRESGYI